MADGNTYQKDGDAGFIGLNSRDNPSSLPQGYVSESINYRLDSFVAVPRKGLARKTIGSLVDKVIYGSCTYIDTNGQEIIVVVTETQLWYYNPQTEVLSLPIYFPFITGSITVRESITTGDGCDLIQAIDKIFITRGYNKRPLVWDMGTAIIALESVSPNSGHEFPNCSQLLYYGNRLIAQGKYHSEGNVKRNRDTVCVSNYLDYNDWDILDAFTFNNGSNDQIVAIAPWTLNEFTVFMRHSIFYVNTGVGRYATGAALSEDSFIKTLVTDIGCVSKRSVIQAGGGIIFLSDNGVYIMNPTQVGSNESMRLLTSEKPLSAPIDDIIQRINRDVVNRSVACYWNNRYYLAVPVNSADGTVIATKNNTILIFNFILKAWESIDTFPAGIDIFNFAVCKKNNKSRLYFIDTDQGIFLTEELDADEYGDEVGNPHLPVNLQVSLEESTFTNNIIAASLTTRKYTFGTLTDKRVSGCEVDFLFKPNSGIKTSSIILNKDSETEIDNYASLVNNDETRRTPIRKTGTGVQLKFTPTGGRPEIRSIVVNSTIKGKNIISKK